MGKLYPVASTTVSATINGYITECSARDAIKDTVVWAIKNVMHISRDGGYTYVRVKLAYRPLTIALIEFDNILKICVCSENRADLYSINGVIDNIIYDSSVNKLTSIAVTDASLVLFTKSSARVYNLIDYSIINVSFNEDSIFSFVAPANDELIIGTFVPGAIIKWYSLTNASVGEIIVNGVSNITSLSQYYNETILIECDYSPDENILASTGLYKLNSLSGQISLLTEGNDIEFMAAEDIFETVVYAIDAEGQLIDTGELYDDLDLHNGNSD